MPRPTPRNAIAALFTGILLVAIFATMVIWFRSDLRTEIHQTILERDAAVLYPMALQQVMESEEEKPGNPSAPMTALLGSARQKGMIAVAVFDRDGNTIGAVPSNQLFVELPTDDYLRLARGLPITRFHPSFPLDQYFAGVSPSQRQAPVLEVLLPLPGVGNAVMRGFVRYYIDARPIARELSLIDGRINRQTAVILLMGATLIAIVLSAASFSIQRAQRLAAERNERLARANFELTLAAKASAVGQLASHLIHGLQGSVQGLQAAVADGNGSSPSPAWEAVAGYAERLQTIIHETVALLSDAGAGASYELTGKELAATIRERNLAAADEKGVRLEVDQGFPATIDSHRGSVLCLIANNLVQNAVTATERGRRVGVSVVDTGQAIIISGQDEGAGIPDSMRPHLFKPGKSTRPDGSGLGLAISQLLARQIGAQVSLVSTGPSGTAFRVTLPKQPLSHSG
jgi:signal transduction histidine kinase